MADSDADGRLIWSTKSKNIETLKNIFESEELIENAVVSILETTAADGKNYPTKYYNLDAVIAVGYRVNSKRATLLEFGQQIF